MTSRLKRFAVPGLVVTAVLGASSAVHADQSGPRSAHRAGATVAGDARGIVHSSGSSKADSKARPPNRTVTLITGDQVFLAGGNENATTIRPGPGRRHVKFRGHQAAGRFFVIPSDVTPLLASGRLDRRLFDVTGLVEAGYDDGATRTIPLIVTYDGVTGRSTLRGVGIAASRELPSVNGAAVRVAKGKNFLSGLPLTGRRFGGGVERVWLDGRRRTTLDVSVPQIGTPAAWQAGFTGKGVTVAVLDTGVDATHPDLTDRVVGAKNFTAEAAGDLVGHGTHVASTIGGTGAASGGKYRGVAPGATLLDGKVCEREGCPESAILAGMQWAAVEQRADVVNLSLGGPDSPEVDLLEEAVNTLTARTGALFVIAAGNSGPGAGTVDSPGSADAALTVGAVDRRDQIAEFSSRGPRAGGGMVKPDVTAPGVEIVAAKAKDSSIGDPVAGQYLRLSGTSMATPHTAGAAALLAQQHPAWTPQELKAALMGSAKPHAEQAVLDQGAGRIDLARAVTHTVATVEGSVSFATARWPHHDDVPVARQLTYRNYGTAAVTLALRGELTGPGGQAPASALSLSASAVTVPAGGTATVTVTSDTRHDGADGTYSGRITATAAGGQTVTTPLAVAKEAESYDLTVSHLDTHGEPGAGETLVYNHDNSEWFFVSGQAATVRVPKGRYLVNGLITDERGPGQTDVHFLLQPMLDLTADAEVSIDARLSKPVDVTVPRRDARAAVVDAVYNVEAGPYPVGSFVTTVDRGRLFTAQLGGPLPAPHKLVSRIGSQWGVPGPKGDFAGTPYTYNLVNTQRGAFHHGLTRKVTDGELAKVTSRHNAQVRGRRAVKVSYGWVPDVWRTIGAYFVTDLPSRTTHYVEAGEVTWATGFSEFVLDGNGEPVSLGGLESRHRYQAGRGYADRYNAAVFAPAFPRAGDAVRTGDDVFVNVPAYSDQDGHAGFSETDTTSLRLYREGKLLGESAAYGYLEVVGVPAETGRFELVYAATRPSYSGLSTRTDARWTFGSGTATGDDVQLPLWGMRYRPAVDGHNLVKRRELTVLPVEFATPPGATAGRLRSVDVRVSGDDGKTWAKAAVRRVGGNQYVAVFVTPKDASHVSLKAKAADSAGNTVEQTIIRAHALR